MLSRSELKKRGLDGLKNYFWYGLLAIVIAGVLGGAVVGTVTFATTLISLIPFIGAVIAAPIETIVIGFFAIVLGAGVTRFFIISEGRRESAGIGEIFSCFQSGRFSYVAENCFSFSARIELWSCLLVIPGVMKTYEYFMVPYLIAEYPNMSGRDYFKISTEIMTGRKMEAFVFDLSFIGWYLLGMIPCFLGVPVVLLYHQAARTEYYFALKEEWMRTASGRDFMSSVGGGSSSYNRGEYLETGRPNGIEMKNTSSRQAFLVGTQGEFTGANIPVGMGESLLIGTDASRCSLVIHGAAVAPVHLKITFNGNDFTVTDYSEAGTYNLQGGRLPSRQPVTLQPGTYLQIGAGGDIFSLECR